MVKRFACLRATKKTAIYRNRRFNYEVGKTLLKYASAEEAARGKPTQQKAT
jgi:hypothetical protein